MHCCQESVSGLVSVVFIYKSSLKMVALLSNCSAVDQRDVILFCDLELKHSKTYNRMLSQYGEHGMDQKKVLLLHNNTHPCYVSATVQAIGQLNLELLPHIPYSPDLAPSDYFMFGRLEEALCG